MYIMLIQLNTTCDACTRNCSQSTTINTTLINTLEECTRPIYNVVNIIANHSKKLFKTVKNLKDADNVSKNDLIVQIGRNAEVNDFCLCNI